MTIALSLKVHDGLVLAADSASTIIGAMPGGAPAVINVYNQDAIDLAEFLVHLTIMFSRFSPGAPSVGGPIEIAAVTKHEGFKWIKRKHYYEQRLNP